MTPSGLFGRRADPYAGADFERSTRVGGALLIVSVLCLAGLLPLDPPTAALGAAGWAVAGLIMALCLASAVRLFRSPERVTWNEMYRMSFGALATVALLEWLAGGHSTPYHQFYLLAVVYAAAVHPPRRVLAFLVAFAVAISLSDVYDPWSASQLGETVMYVLVALGIGVLCMVVMSGVREQRVSLQSEGDQARLLADTDPLTGLANRRKLMRDLEEGAARLDPERPLLLAMFDLNGFKAYNDTFGHPAGDTLLRRLAHGLEVAATEAAAVAYRIGGDEFCVLGPVPESESYALVERATCALSDSGEGFEISAAHGAVMLPRDATDATDALRLADQRMYAVKAKSRKSAGRQTTDVLLRVLAERDPRLATHLDEVTELVAGVCSRLGLPDEEVGPILQAASLHDVGKAAVPEEILDKPGPLTDEEWGFMRRHTLIGERILGVAPALADAAKLVRSSHESYDGSGYPDGLRGEAIPLGARIIAICDAYDAMTSTRPYRAAMSSEVALAEVRRCAGTQFDPAVVEAFAAELKAGAGATLPSRSAS
ncbi:MAG TPA: diguanylate cyclase [Thermoleophilaceae bacterium]|nr:diguanylate cyclase [Thermoleophilaceae bacterium]